MHHSSFYIFLSSLNLSCRKLLGWSFGSEGCEAIEDGREGKLETTPLSQNCRLIYYRRSTTPSVSLISVRGPLVLPYFGRNPIMANATNTQLFQHFNLVSPPSYRGTMEILWSSLFTIFTCTWTVQHPNIPEQRSAHKPAWRGSLKWHTKKFCISAGWMMLTTIAPEVEIAIACYDLRAAKKTLRE